MSLGDQTFTLLRSRPRNYHFFFTEAGFLAAGFLAAGFLATGFLATGFLAAGFLAAGFLAAGFFATGFLAAGFLAGAGFLAAGFFATGFLATGFFAGAGFLAAGFFATGFLAAGFFAGAGFLAAGFFAVVFVGLVAMGLHVYFLALRAVQIERNVRYIANYHKACFSSRKNCIFCSTFFIFFACVGTFPVAHSTFSPPLFLHFFQREQPA